MKQIDYAKRTLDLILLFAVFSMVTSFIPIYFNQIHKYPDGNTFVQQKYLECMKAERSEYLCKTFIKVRYDANL